MANFGNEVIESFRDAAESDQILSARYTVLDTASSEFTKLADLLQTSGWVFRNDKELATALLIRLASELSGGIADLARKSKIYAAGALLRQLIEIEYLMFVGCMDPSKLEQWYRADSEELRKTFTPQQMRKLADGLFRDQEYWMHCEVGGHPNPKSKILLSAYGPTVPPIAGLLPDAVQHTRRLWTSVKLLLPQLNIGETALEDCGQELDKALGRWENVENPVILSFDGISQD